MITRRLYYTDSYANTFEAQVVEQVTVEGTPAVVLNRTFFYPTSGGQPHDTGTLNGIPVRDVMVREADEAVLHLLAAPLPAGPVEGQIDWPRRFDHMRHHTGQHILSQAFVQLAGAETVGFHMSPDSITIDLDRPTIPAELVDAVEDLANEIVAGNRPVRAWFPTEVELPDLALRKVPDVAGKLRVVDIAGFDTTACGGTHVAHTGEVGIIKVLRVDRRGDSARIEFRCGRRALLDYRQKNALLNQFAAGITDIPAVLHKLRAENKTLRREVRTLQSAVLDQEAEQLWQSAGREDGYVLVVRAFENRAVDEVRQLAQRLIARPATVALCGIAGEKAHLITARSDDLPHDMVPVLKAGLGVWECQRGGGRPSFAQGGGVAASPGEVQRALQAAVAALRDGDN